jgi:hypothetical protein
MEDINALGKNLKSPITALSCMLSWPQTYYFNNLDDFLENKNNIKLTGYKFGFASNLYQKAVAVFPSLNYKNLTEVEKETRNNYAVNLIESSKKLINDLEAKKYSTRSTIILRTVMFNESLDKLIDLVKLNAKLSDDNGKVEVVSSFDLADDVMISHPMIVYDGRRLKLAHFDSAPGKVVTEQPGYQKLSRIVKEFIY